MRKIYVIFNVNGAISQCSDVEYDDEGNIIVMSGHEGPFEVPDEFGQGEYELQYYRLEDGKLVIDDKAKLEFKSEQEQWARENRRHQYRVQAVSRLQEIQATAVVKEMDAANEIISLAPLLREWIPQAYTIGDIIQYADAPYRCVQAHDATGNPGWNPADAASLWAKYHATSAEYALLWAQPTSAHDAYQKNEYMEFTDGNVYRCKINNTVHAPDVLPGAWERV